MSVLPSLCLCVLAVLCLFLLRGEGLLKKPSTLFLSAAILALAFCLRAAAMPHVTLDYEDFLSKWVAYFRENGGFSAIPGYRGNYNIPYLYFLALFSYSSIPDLYLIKLLSIVFDVVLAWGVLRLAGHFQISHTRKLVAFLGTLLLPTVILNGAYWGQCDSIYVALAVWALYFVLERRGVLSMVFLALSFSFKLQAVFFIPAYLVFLFTGRLKWRHVPVFPLTYVLVILPAVLLGKPFLETLTLYLGQTDSVGTGLNYNSPSVFALIQSDQTAIFTPLGIAAAFLFLFVVYVWIWRRRACASDTILLIVSLLFVLGIPFFLPRMHDRYFFGADVLSFAAAVALLRLIPVPVLCSFASLLGYHAYLRGAYLLPMSCGGAALVVALLWLVFELADRLHAPPRRRSR